MQPAFCRLSQCKNYSGLWIVCSSFQRRRSFSNAVGRDSVEPTFERSEANAVSFCLSSDETHLRSSLRSRLLCRLIMARPESGPTGFRAVQRVRHLGKMSHPASPITEPRKPGLEVFEFPIPAC